MGDQQELLPLIVVEGENVPLLGRQWLMSVTLPWNRIISTSVNIVKSDEKADVLHRSTVYRLRMKQE